MPAYEIHRAISNVSGGWQREATLLVEVGPVPFGDEDVDVELLTDLGLWWCEPVGAILLDEASVRAN